MSWSPRSVSCVAARQTLCLGARPRYNLVVDEDVKKPTKQTMYFDERRRYETTKTMAAPVRTNQVNQVIRHPRTNFRAVIVNVNKRSASAFIPNYLLGVDLFNSKSQSKVKSQRGSNDNLFVNSIKV